MKFKKIIILLWILVLVSLPIYIFMFKKGDNQNSIPEKNEVKEETKKENKQQYIKITDDLMVKDYEITYDKDNKTWSLNLTIINSSDKDIKLGKYEVLLYDKDNNLIKADLIDNEITISKSGSHTIYLESLEDISKTDHIEVKNI